MRSPWTRRRSLLRRCSSRAGEGRRAGSPSIYINACIGGAREYDLLREKERIAFYSLTSRPTVRLGSSSSSRPFDAFTALDISHLACLVFLYPSSLSFFLVHMLPLPHLYNLYTLLGLIAEE